MELRSPKISVLTTVRIIALFLLAALGILLLQDGQRPCCTAIGEVGNGTEAWELCSPPVGGRFGNPVQLEIEVQARKNGKLLSVVPDGKNQPLCSLYRISQGIQLEAQGGSGLFSVPQNDLNSSFLLTVWMQNEKMQIRLMQISTRKTMILNTVSPSEHDSSTLYLLHFKENCTLSAMTAKEVRFSPLLQLGMISVLLIWLALEEFFFLQNLSAKESDVVLRRVKFTASLLFCGIAVATAAVWFNGCCGRVNYPYNTWLYWQEARFGDFHDVFPRISPVLNVYLANVRGANYFPLIYCLISPLSLLKEPVALGVFLALGMVFYLVSPYCFFAVRNLRSCCWMLLLLCCAYPVQFAFDRGNLEFLVYALVLLFSVAYWKKHYTVAALLLAMAINCKLYPGVLGVLFLADRRWREAGLTALFSAALFLIAAAVTRCSLPLLMENLRVFNEFSSTSCNGISFNHTLYGAARAIGFVWLDFPAVRGGELQGIFSLIAVVVFGWVLWAVCTRVRKYWERLFLLTGCYLLLPHFSFDYTLMHLMVPLFFFIFRPEPEKREWMVLTGFALLLVPMNFWQFGCYPEIQIAVIVKPLLLAAMMLHIILTKTDAA